MTTVGEVGAVVVAVAVAHDRARLDCRAPGRATSSSAALLSAAAARRWHE